MTRTQKHMKNINQLAFISSNKLWESDFDIIDSKKNKVQDMNIIQLKLKVHDTYRRDEKVTTYFEAVNDSDVINKDYLDGKISKIDDHLSFLEKTTTELY